MLSEAISSPSTVFNPISIPIPTQPLGVPIQKESPRAVATKPGYISYDAALKGILRIKSIEWIDGNDSDQISETSFKDIRGTLSLCALYSEDLSMDVSAPSG